MKIREIDKAYIPINTYVRYVQFMYQPKCSIFL